MTRITIPMTIAIIAGTSKDVKCNRADKSNTIIATTVGRAEARLRRTKRSAVPAADIQKRHGGAQLGIRPPVSDWSHRNSPYPAHITDTPRRCVSGRLRKSPASRETKTLHFIVRNPFIVWGGLDHTPGRFGHRSARRASAGPIAGQRGLYNGSTISPDARAHHSHRRR